MNTNTANALNQLVSKLDSLKLKLEIQEELEKLKLEIHNIIWNNETAGSKKINNGKIKNQQLNKEVETLRTERDSLVQENATFKMLMTEMQEEIDTLRFLINENPNQILPATEIRPETDIEDTTCAVCREEMQLKRCTSCRRNYHEHCVNRWLNEHRTCPTCRATWND